MTDYTKLVKELRGCKDMDYCTDCPRMANGYVEFCNIKDDAAAAIEALQAENADIREELFISQRKYDEFTTIASMQNAMLAKQLPKRGEWIGVSPMVDTVQCSVCGGQLFSAELETPYCPYCGAKMEVQG